MILPGEIINQDRALKVWITHLAETLDDTCNPHIKNSDVIVKMCDMFVTFDRDWESMSNSKVWKRLRFELPSQ